MKNDISTPQIIASKGFAMVLGYIGYQERAQESPRKCKLRKVVLFKVKGYTGVIMSKCSNHIVLHTKLILGSPYRHSKLFCIVSTTHLPKASR